jgi:glycosyltransferase involved in cell wall biosynthesis
MPDREVTPTYRTAVLIPCYNEEAAIRKVVTDFAAALPEATVYVYDNDSQDRTAEFARAAGAVVRNESLRGKGNVVRRMFADIDADVYVLVDGDDTYHAPSAPAMIEQLIDRHLDMVSGVRVDTNNAAYRPGHRLGNLVLTRLVACIFGNQFTDMLSGYRAFSRRFVKSFPALSSGFEIETELTVHALELRMRVAEVETPYGNRPEGSTSKLRTVGDGLRVLRTIAALIKEERPLLFFSIIAALLAILSVVLALPIFRTYLETGLVPRFPTAILCSALGLLACLSFYAGLILDTVTTGRRELKRLVYLRLTPGEA